MRLWRFNIDAAQLATLTAGLSIFWHKLVKRWPAPYVGQPPLTLMQRIRRMYCACFDAAQDEFGNNARIGERSTDPNQLKEENK